MNTPWRVAGGVEPPAHGRSRHGATTSIPGRRTTMSTSDRPHTVVDIYSRAATLIRYDGLAKTGQPSEPLAVNVAEALVIASGLRCGQPGEITDDSAQVDMLMTAINGLIEHVDGPIGEWNDDPATTQDAVVETLEGLAAMLSGRLVAVPVPLQAAS